MRILCVIDHLGPAGAQSQLVTLATSLKSRGHEVEFFVYYPEIDYFRARLDDAQIPIRPYRKRSRYDVGPLRALRDLVRRGDFDVSVSFLTTPNIYNALACRGTKTRSVVSERSAFFSTVPLPFRVRFETYRMADHIVINSHHQHRRLCDSIRWMKDRSSVIVNGVDLDRFTPPGVQDSVIPADSDQRPISLLAVGSIHANKNFGGLVDALLKCRQSNRAIPIVRWAGRDPSEEADRSAFAEAVRKLDAADLADTWEWLGVRRDIPQLLAESDAFIHPSFYEGLPNAVCEALAAGRPVLASNVCDHPWLVEDGERGLLFDPHDPDDIAASIERFASLPPEERRRMGLSARVFAEKNLALDVFADNYERLFRSLT